MQNMDAGWQGFILRSGIEKNEIIHSLIKHSFEREERMEYSKKKKLVFFNKTIFFVVLLKINFEKLYFLVLLKLSETSVRG